VSREFLDDLRPSSGGHVPAGCRCASGDSRSRAVVELRKTLHSYGGGNIAASSSDPSGFVSVIVHSPFQSAERAAAVESCMWKRPSGGHGVSSARACVSGRSRAAAGVDRHPEGEPRVALAVGRGLAGLDTLARSLGCRLTPGVHVSRHPLV